MLYQQNSDGTGEVCIWGRHVFMGYLEREQDTMEVIDEEGWLHSGDLGHMDSQGFLFISGRVKGTGTGLCQPPASRRVERLEAGRTCTGASPRLPAWGPSPGVRSPWSAQPGLSSGSAFGPQQDGWEDSRPNTETRFLRCNLRTTVCRLHD